MPEDPNKRDSGTRKDEPADALLRLLDELARELHPHRPPAARITIDSSIDNEIGLDSLARLELLPRVEDLFDVTLPERAFSVAETPRDLLRAIQSARSGSRRAKSVKATPLELGDAEEAPRTAATLIEALDWHVAHHPDRPHIRFYSDEGNGEVITYKNLKENGARVAGSLLARGLEADEPVALMLAPTREYFFCFLGVLLAGGIPVPLYPPARPSQIEDHLHRHESILKSCGAVALVTMPEALRFARLMGPRVETLDHVLTPADLADGAEPYERAGIGTRDTAFLQYTSGSTGNPKGVILTHANLLANIRAIGERLNIDSTDVAVSWLPLYHDMGLIGGWFCSLYYASHFVLMSPLDFLARPERWFTAIHRFKGTLSASPNFGYEICLHRIRDEQIEHLDLSSWRVACNGAEPVSPETVERFVERFAPLGVRPETMMPVYGLAESTVGLTFPPYGRAPVIERIQREPFSLEGRAVPAEPDDTTAIRFVACGRPLAGHDIRIVDSVGGELPDAREGRLQFKGPSATSGYYRNKAATSRLFDGEWLESGDLAYVSNGDVFVTGRSKDVIIRAGRNIYPQELEAAVGSVEGIRKGNVAVFGSADSESGIERLVVVAETNETDPEAIERIRKDVYALSNDVVGAPPDDVVLAPRGSVLKTSSGKIRRSASRELYERGEIGKTTRAVWRQVARLAFSGVLPRIRRLRRRAAEVIFAAYAVTVATFFWLCSFVGITFGPRMTDRWRAVHWCARAMFRATCSPLVVRGIEKIPRDRHSVIVANHASYLDSFVLCAALPIPVSFVAKAELKNSLILRFYLSRLRTEFVDRFDKQRGTADARRIARHAREGRTLLFYPEGGMERRPGLRTFKMGAFAAAADADLPVVPLAIRGTRSILRPDSRVVRRSPVTIDVGDAFEPADVRKELAEPDSWTVALELRARSRAYILKHCGEPDLGNRRTR
jgi:1-acyl-sn-glycerol-3-phosphate acyltransferase